MSEQKKDLTRIEDLAEYIHELSEKDSTLDETPPELPDENVSNEPVFDGGDSSSVEASDDLNFTSNFSDSTEEKNLETSNLESNFSSEENFTSEEFTSGDFTTDNSSGTSIEFNDNSEVDSNFSSSSDSLDFNSPENSQSTEEINENRSFATEENSFPNDEDNFYKNDENISTEMQNPSETLDSPEKVNEQTTQVFDSSTLDIKSSLSNTVPTNQTQHISPEDFKDLKKFAENTSLTGMAAEGNPSFSVLISGIQYTEDAEDILILLKELSLINEDEEATKRRLLRGSFLVPRISEYAAIFLSHKLRRFDVDIQVGLSDDIHPPKHGEKPETGLVSKHSLYQNQSHHFHFSDPKIEISQIIISSTSNLEGYQIVKYIGVATEYHLIDQHVLEDETSNETPKLYNELAIKLKAHALKLKANAVVGINYQITPLPGEIGNSHIKYRLSCTGNLVWVNKL